MNTSQICLGLRLVVLLMMLGADAACEAQVPTYSWTVLQPQNDPRTADVRSFDEFFSQSLVATMNRSEPLFQHRLTWNQVRIKDLLGFPTPFTELRFDALHPPALTLKEKAILREYLARGGFIMLIEDCYPYSQDKLWSVKSWPVVDFLTRELPASDPDFTVQRLKNEHMMFHQYYQTKINDLIQHELENNPSAPSQTLLSYRGHPCAYVVGQYFALVNGKWMAEPKPYPHVFKMRQKDYELSVNVYVYATMH